MKCPKCGKEVAGNFCPECGQPLNTQPSPAAGAASVPNKPSKKKGTGCRVVVLVSLVLAIIGAALGGQEKPASSTQHSANSSSQAVTSSQPASQPESSSSESQDAVTTGQKNALRAAEQYLSVMPFSYSGLSEQLEFDSYSEDDATYAADNCGADWNEQAAKAAKNYLDVMAFSRDGLIEQLVFDGYTQEQAEYGASQNGY